MLQQAHYVNIVTASLDYIYIITNHLCRWIYFVYMFAIPKKAMAFVFDMILNSSTLCNLRKGVRFNMVKNMSENLRKIKDAFSELHEKTKKFMMIGVRISLILLAIGTILVGVNVYVLNHDAYFSFIANSIVKSSISILAEIVIGCLLIDLAFKSKKR